MANQDNQQGGEQKGGGPTEADMASAGGSSGTGGYGQAQNQQNHQGQGQASYGNSGAPDQSRGERFDEMQGGGRSSDSVSGEDGGDQEQGNPAGDEFLQDRMSHQDRGRGNVEEQDEAS